jgi:hypothetical protein
MTIPQDGSNLIFLFSQPRAGSTLLQRILGRHPDIHTVAEPWIMLPSFYVMRPDRCEAEYTTQGAWIGLSNFLNHLPGKEEDYYQGVRQMFGYLYGQALAPTGKRFFLDKTPRYFLIIPEITRVFPKARFIFLFRNPLAVLCSIRETWLGDNWLALDSQRIDLLDAPRLLTEGQERVNGEGLTIHYERLVANPENEVRRICEGLGIDFRPDMIEYGRGGVERWVLGDPRGVYQHSRPMAENADKWAASLRDPQLWRLVHDYLKWLGPEQVDRMGYSYLELSATVDAARPPRRRLWFTFSLATVTERCPTARRHLLGTIQRVRNAVLRHGLVGATAAGLRKALPFQSHGNGRPQPGNA